MAHGGGGGAWRRVCIKIPKTQEKQILGKVNFVIATVCEFHKQCRLDLLTLHTA